ncbi:heme-degrading domain-containing protein [Streptomyces sp. NPDC050560]|uniref:heme-degrading domain-containing protein n=1 Tax=Streptomyces sp. NPDC050560 TaxID=3365630 RepID=UPI00378DF57B
MSGQDNERRDHAAWAAARQEPQDHAAELAELAAQEEHLVLPGFGPDDAWRLGTLLVDLAKGRGAPVAIDIHHGAQQLFHAALPGATPDNAEWIARKRRVVERYQQSSYRVGTHHRARGTTFEEATRLDPAVYAAHGGSFPLRVRGTGVVGAVTVSGLPQKEDHDLVVTALTRFLDGAGAAAG